MLLAAAILLSGFSPAQSNTGFVEGVVHTPNGRTLGGAPISITGPSGFRVLIHADSQGQFSITLPYGRYQFAVQREGASPGVTVVVASSKTTRVELVVDPSQAGMPVHRTASPIRSASAANDSP